MTGRQLPRSPPRAWLLASATASTVQGLARRSPGSPGRSFDVLSVSHFGTGPDRIGQDWKIGELDYWIISNPEVQYWTRGPILDLSPILDPRRGSPLGSNIGPPSPTLGLGVQYRTPVWENLLVFRQFGNLQIATPIFASAALQLCE